MFDFLRRLASIKSFCETGGRLGARSFEAWSAARRHRRASGMVRHGIESAGRGHFGKAKRCYARAIGLVPEHVEARHNLAGLQIRQGEFSEACLNLLAALEERPLGPEVLNRLGVALRGLNRLEETTVCLRQALMVMPGSGEALNNLGDAYQALVMGSEALGCYARAQVVLPNSAAVCSNLGTAQRDAGDFTAADESFRQALALDRDHGGAHFNQGTLALLQGKFRAGWEGYEWRDRANGFKPSARYIDTQWSGAAIRTKTIYVHAEQGLGDMLQFVRYIPLLADRCDKVILRLPDALRRTMDGMERYAEIIGPEDRVPRFDVHSPLSSLPFAFGIREATIPHDPQYLWAEPLLVEKWNAALTNGGRPRIGLIWATGVRSETSTKRTIGLDHLAPLLGDKRVRWISLQLPPRAADLSRLPPHTCVDLSAQQPDMAETAAIIAGLDLVITVDTSIAHLAGALGRPVWVMLPHVPDWRWMLDRMDSPWYPSMRLFRQKSPGDWTSVIDTLRGALEERLS